MHVKTAPRQEAIMYASHHLYIYLLKWSKYLGKLIHGEKQSEHAIWLDQQSTTQLDNSLIGSPSHHMETYTYVYYRDVLFSDTAAVTKHCFKRCSVAWKRKLSCCQNVCCSVKYMHIKIQNIEGIVKFTNIVGGRKVSSYVGYLW